MEICFLKAQNYGKIHERKPAQRFLDNLQKFGISNKIAKTVLTGKKYGARLAFNKGKGALRMILKALFPLQGKIANGRKPAAQSAKL